VTPARLLVLGAGGFIGAHVRSALRSAGWDGVAYVSRTTGELDDSNDLRERWHTVDLATAGRDELATVLRAERPEAVINCSGVTEGSVDRLVRGNVVVVGELLAAMAGVVPGSRLVHVGSSAEYGAVPVGTAISEVTPANPVGPYGLTKLAGSELVLAAGRAKALDAVVLRVFNPIGSGISANTLPGKTVAAIRAALAGGDRRISLGALDDHRDFVDVTDVAEAICAAASAAAAPLGPRVLNVGSGRATLARDLVTQLAAVAGFDGEIAEDRRSSARPGAVPWQQADIAAIAEVLNWRPRRELAESIEAVWAAANHDGGSRPA
jgi:nucleoside-diphosphate-sugar epimerase